jgi:glycosyltransferase involved in cell wall biosynthesis
MNLSFCAIVKNEEKNLPRCLESVKAIADELIILDTGSTDKTPEIARSFGAKVYSFDWCDDFAAARNAALAYVTGDWVLVLDADERIEPEIIPLLKQAIAVYSHLLINLMRQEIGASQSPYSLVSRLFRRHPALYFSRPYHASIDDSLQILLQQEPQWQIVQLPQVAILHDGYQASAIAAGNKLDRAKKAMEGYFSNHPDDAYVCSKLGALYVQMGAPDRGIEVLKTGLAGASIEWPVLYELHYHLGIAYTRTAQFERAVAHYQSAIAIDILPALKLGAYNNFGNFLKERGHFQLALEAYEIVLKIDPTLAIAHYNLGLTLKAMGKLEKAIEAYQQAIHLNPNYAAAHQNLGVVFLKIGRVSESLIAFKTAIDLYRTENSPTAEQLSRGLKEMGLDVDVEFGFNSNPKSVVNQSD